MPIVMVCWASYRHGKVLFVRTPDFGVPCAWCPILFAHFAKRMGDGVIGALYERSAAGAVEKSHAGDDCGVSPFKKRRVVHPAPLCFSNCSMPNIQYFQGRVRLK